MIPKLKNFLKRILPPPVRTFVREIERVLAAIGGQGKKTVAKLESIERRLSKQERREVEQESKQAEQFSRIIEEQKKQSETLSTVIAQQCEQIERLKQQIEQFAKLQGLTENKTWELAARQESTLANTIASLELLEKQKDSIERIQPSIQAKGADYVAQLERAIKKVEDALPEVKINWENEYEKRVVWENWGDVTECFDFEDKYLKLISGLDSKSIQIISRIIARQKKYLNNDAKTLNLFLVMSKKICAC